MGTAPSGGVKGAIWSRYWMRSYACTAFCHFICGHQSSVHCSQQRKAPVVSSRTSAKRWWALRLDKIHLFRVVRAQQRVDLRDVALAGADDEAELLRREARVVGLVVLAEAAVRQPADDQQAEQRRERAEQDGELEADHGVGRDRGERLAADHHRPVERHPDRHRVAGHHAEQAPHEGVEAHLARLRVERDVELGEGSRGVDLKVAEAAVAQPRRHLGDGPRRVEDALERRHQWAPWAPCARSWIASSFTSAIAITGKTFRNIRNNIAKNAKLPVKIVSSAQDGVYTPHTAGSYSRDRPVMMMT